MTTAGQTQTQATASEGSLGLGWTSQQVRGMRVLDMYKDACAVPANVMLMHEVHADRTVANATDAYEAYAYAGKVLC